MLRDRVRVIKAEYEYCGMFGEIIGVYPDGYLLVALEDDNRIGFEVRLHPQDLELARRLPLWWSQGQWVA
jgi:hypothetical protein